MDILNIEGLADGLPVSKKDDNTYLIGNHEVPAAAYTKALDDGLLEASMIGSPTVKLTAKGNSQRACLAPM